MTMELLAREPLRGVSSVLAGLSIVSLAVGGLCSMFPLWKSATLSPDSIQRRTYWAGSAATVVLLFLAFLPDWQLAMFVSIFMGLALFTVAGMWTNHVKIRGRIYAGLPSNRRPDRPPALAQHPAGDDDL